MSVGTYWVLDASILAGALSGPDIWRREGERLVNLRSGENEALVTQIQAGQQDLMADLVRQHSDRLFAVILRMVQSHSTAEDILQNTWVRVIRKFHQYDPSRPFVPWLTQVAINCCRDFWRRERLRQFLSLSSHSEKPEVLDPKIATESQKALGQQIEISKALANLSPKLREVIVLKFYSDLTHDEIAEVLRISAGTVKSRLNYALFNLRKYFDKKGEGK